MIGLNDVPGEVLRQVYDAIDITSLTHLGASWKTGAAAVARNIVAERQREVLDWARERLDTLAEITAEMHAVAREGDKSAGDLFAQIDGIMDQYDDAFETDRCHYHYPDDFDNYISIDIWATKTTPEGCLQVQVGFYVNRRGAGWLPDEYIKVEFGTKAYWVQVPVRATADWRTNPVVYEYGDVLAERVEDAADDMFMTPERVMWVIRSVLSPACAEAVQIVLF